MQLGILLCGSGLTVPSWKEGFGLARDMGYTCVELGAVDATGDWPGLDLGHTDSEQAAVDVVETARASGLEVSALQCHVEYLQADAESVRIRIEHTRRMLRYAAAAHVPIVHTVTGPAVEDLDEDRQWRTLQETYSELIDAARQLDGVVRLAVEPVFAYLVGNMATTARLLDGLEADSLGVNFDPSHFPYHDEDPVPFIRRFGSRIVHAHLKDAVVRDASQDLPNAFPMRDGRKFAFAPPGEGCLDFARILCALRDTGFDGVLSLELGHGVSDPRRAARRTVGFVRGVCEQCGIPIGNPGKRSC